MSASHREELGAFLRTRRERLCPTEVGLPMSKRRRTPGLRREEVAELAGISLSWYTWLEQGRAKASEQVLRSVARVLRLDTAETAHVLAFVDSVDTRRESVRWASPNMVSLVQGMGINPAVVIDQHWDLLAWNPGYAALLTDPARLPAHCRNLLWLVFRWAPVRTLLAAWEPEARALLGQFRGKAAHHPDDARFAEITASLTEDPDAARWLADHELAGFAPAVRHFRHPEVGDLRLRYVKLAAVDEPDHHFLAYLPDDADAERGLRALARNG